MGVVYEAKDLKVGVARRAQGAPQYQSSRVSGSPLLPTSFFTSKV